MCLLATAGGADVGLVAVDHHRPNFLLHPAVSHPVHPAIRGSHDTGDDMWRCCQSSRYTTHLYLHSSAKGLV